MKKIFYTIYAAAHNNAVSLLSEAEILYKNKSFARAYFLAFTALEEIAKSQLAADVCTDLIQEKDFLSKYNKHDQKINNVTWAYLDANEFHDENNKPIKVSKPKIKKRMLALYVDVDNKNNIILPHETIKEKDAKEIMQIVQVALHQIMIATKYFGNQIGTKGFMK